MKIYNSMTKKKEEFIPLKEGEVTIYSCGPTVYNYFHIGNARPFIIFDTLRRYLEYRGYKVKYVQNFTDIDDKMIKRAAKEGITVRELAEKYIEEYFVDAKGLNIKKATFNPRATEHIEAIIDLIKKLESKGYAYEIGGDVYFDTEKFKEYGKLSGYKLEDLEAGARVSVDERKRNSMDFVLWKAKKPGEPSWNSPWGEGRPGWHIECSAMATHYLGNTIDIHSGGQDLIFPHHENEIAQSEAATGKKFVRYWMHNGFININNEKMSKSKGNFFTVRDIVKYHDYEVIRFFMLSAHYRNPINFSEDLLLQAESGLGRIYECFENLVFKERNSKDLGEVGEEVRESLLKYKRQFIKAMDDDLNTADALAAIFELIREINTMVVSAEPSLNTVRFCKKLLIELTDVLGILQKKDEEKLDSEVEELIKKREKARKEKNYKLADGIRDKLKSMGIEIQDTPQGVKYKTKKI